MKIKEMVLKFESARLDASSPSSTSVQRCRRGLKTKIIEENDKFTETYDSPGKRRRTENCDKMQHLSLDNDYKPKSRQGRSLQTPAKRRRRPPTPSSPVPPGGPSMPAPPSCGGRRLCTRQGGGGTTASKEWENRYCIMPGLARICGLIWTGLFLRPGQSEAAWTPPGSSV